MFKKLVANLPFNPSLIAEIGFYTERLKAEKVVRRLSFMFIVAAMFVQMFAVITPPQRSLAASANHILDGLSSYNSTEYNRNYLLKSWDENADVRAIYSYFGLTRSDLESTVKDTVFSQEADYWTTGRNSLSGYSEVDQQYKNTQITIEYEPGKNVYMRQLKAWDIVNKSGQNKTGLKGTIKATGETFWILYDCGNFTKIGKYIPPPPPPPPKNPLSAVCSLTGPIILKEEDKSVSIPVRITLPKGKTVPKGSTSSDGNSGTGLHIGVTTVGGNKNWNVSDNSKIAQPPLVPPDKQTDYIPTNTSTKGLSYYDFVWDVDGQTYRRYYVTSAQSTSFEVTINVKINKLDKNLAVRLLDRDLGAWLPHNSSCEVPLTRKVPPPPTPNLKIVKTILNKPSVLKPGDTFTYLIQYKNTVNASVAENVVITDKLDTEHFTVVSVSPTEAKVNSAGVLKLELGNLASSNEYQNIKITVRLKDEISSGTSVCNASKITATNANADEKSVCVGVITPCPYDSTVDNIDNPNCKTPKLVCEVVDYAVNRTTRKASYRTTVTSTNPANTTVKGYQYSYGDDVEESFASSQYQHEATHTYQPGEYSMNVVITFQTTGQDETTDQTITCAANIDFDEDQAVGQSKTVRNITQDKTGELAQKTTVRGKDVLEYKLATTNAQNYERTNIEVSDYIGDILDYAELDEAFLKEQGGTFDKATNKITWSNVTIPANGEVLHAFQVKIKDPIPSTNLPSAMTTNFDCKISNEYGNEITINVSCPLVKGIETLPNTGPGSSLMALTGITFIVGYFFSRSRLLAREMDLVRIDYASTGGM